MKTPTQSPIRRKILAAGVRNLREFGYPDCDANNIMTDYIYSRFFLQMLRDHPGNEPEIKRLIAEMEAM